MLIITRHAEEGLVFNEGEIQLTIVRINGGEVDIGISAPPEIKVLREELTTLDATTNK